MNKEKSEDFFEQLRKKGLEKFEDELTPLIYFERVIELEEKPGVQLYRIHYGNKTIFIDSNDEFDPFYSEGMEDKEKEKILRQFKKYKDSEEGQDKLREVLERQAKEDD